MLNRRELIRMGGGISASALAASAQPSGPSRTPRNVVLMVADGMSPAVLALAEKFSRIVRGRGTAWSELLQDGAVVHGLMDTASLNSVVTDSAAASTAWGSGSRVFNGVVNILPDGTKLVPIAELSRSVRKRVGLVTTTTVTHATPAGLAAVQQRRDDEHFIAPQYLDRVDVVMGGGARFFEPAARKDGKDLLGQYASRGYRCLRSRAELKGIAAGDRICGLFHPGHLPYMVDWRESESLQETVPTLAEMTGAALAALNAQGSGFLLMVEGGRVDHAAHANDAAGMLWDQLAFDEALETALHSAARMKDTLVVLCSDHGTANPGLNGMGPEYRQSPACFERLAKAKCSYSALSSRLGADKTRPEAVVEILRHSFDLPIGIAEATAIASAFGGKRGASLARQHDSPDGVLGQVLSNYTGVGWTGTSHTSDFTVLTGLGPGAERFRGLVRNTDVFRHLSDLMGIRFRNPAMDPSKARQFASRPAAPKPHWV